MFFLGLVYAGLEALKEYIALHVITCLIPAFLLAGAMVTFISKETIIHYLGAAAHKIKSFALASGGSFFVAACSCTVIPVSGGLYYAGSGIGPAFIVLWVVPAANILAIVYTGAILGDEMVIVRVLSALAMAFVVGWVMSSVFRREEAIRGGTGIKLNPGKRKIVAKGSHLAPSGCGYFTGSELPCSERTLSPQSLYLGCWDDHYWHLCAEGQTL